MLCEDVTAARLAPLAEAAGRLVEGASALESTLTSAFGETLCAERPAKEWIAPLVRSHLGEGQYQSEHGLASLSGSLAVQRK